jgi:hypothetical protein
VDDRARGAIDLFVAMHRAGKAFHAYGYAQFLAHQSVTWQYLSALGRSVDPFAMVGASFDLHDKIDRAVSLSVSLYIRHGDFVVEGDAMVDDPLPIPGGGANKHFLRWLPEVRTADVDEAIEAIERMTAELCAYESVLDDLQIPRTERH